MKEVQNIVERIEHLIIAKGMSTPETIATEANNNSGVVKQTIFQSLRAVFVLQFLGQIYGGIWW